jgi:hypothetical protein
MKIFGPKMYGIPEQRTCFYDDVLIKCRLVGQNYCMFHVCLHRSVVEVTEFCFSTMHLLSCTGNSLGCN